MISFRLDTAQFTCARASRTWYCMTEYILCTGTYFPEISTEKQNHVSASPRPGSGFVWRLVRIDSGNLGLARDHLHPPPGPRCTSTYVCLILRFPNWHAGTVHSVRYRARVARARRWLDATARPRYDTSHESAAMAGEGATGGRATTTRAARLLQGGGFGFWVAGGLTKAKSFHFFSMLRNTAPLAFRVRRALLPPPTWVLTPCVSSRIGSKSLGYVASWVFAPCASSLVGVFHSLPFRFCVFPE